VSRTALLLATMDEAYARLRARLEGLTDDELLWQPVPDCWTIYPEASGRWTYHYAVPAPDPAPVTTIGWQLVHVATCKVMYHEWAYGAARLTWPDLDIPHTAADAIALLEHGQALLRADLADLAEPELDEPRGTNWGQTWPAWRIFTAMTDHDALHAGTIGCLRDVYHWNRGALGPARKAGRIRA
jgi:hypothetical protein